VELVSEEAVADATASVVPEVAAPAASVPSNLPSAVALYDYEAAEENEITFSEGEVIANIDFVSEDWWCGMARNITGLFPSNYVELKN
jgi:drebrin-like protein